MWCFDDVVVVVEKYQEGVTMQTASGSEMDAGTNIFKAARNQLTTPIAAGSFSTSLAVSGFFLAHLSQSIVTIGWR